MKYTKKTQKTKKTHKQTIKSDKQTYNNKYINKYLKQAENIFNDLTFIKNIIDDKFEKYYIISNNYNSYLNDNRYYITHFFLYCLLRFREHKYSDIVNNFLNLPVNFNIRGFFSYSNKYHKNNSFTYLFYLNNFIYNLI